MTDSYENIFPGHRVMYEGFVTPDVVKRWTMAAEVINTLHGDELYIPLEGPIAPDGAAVPGKTHLLIYTAEEGGGNFKEFTRASRKLDKLIPPVGTVAVVAENLAVDLENGREFFAA